MFEEKSHVRDFCASFEEELRSLLKENGPAFSSWSAPCKTARLLLETMLLDAYNAEREEFLGTK